MAILILELFPTRHNGLFISGKETSLPSAARLFPYICVVANCCQLIDAKRLLHRITLVPDENVVAREFGRPLGRKSVDTLRGNPVDVVVINRPRIAFVQWVQRFTDLGRGQGRRGRLLDVSVELRLHLHIGMSADASNVAANDGIPIHLADILDPSKFVKDVLRNGKATPGHPAGKHGVNYHQDSLLRCVNEDISWRVPRAEVGKFENLTSDM